MQPLGDEETEVCENCELDIDTECICEYDEEHFDCDDNCLGCAEKDLEG